MNDKTKAVIHITAPDNQEFTEKGVIVNITKGLNGVCAEVFLPTKPIASVGTLQDMIDKAEADKKAFPLVWFNGWECANKDRDNWENMKVEPKWLDTCEYRRHQYADIIMKCEQDKIDYPDFWLELVQLNNLGSGWYTPNKDFQFRSENYKYRQHPHRKSIIAWHGCSEVDKGRWQINIMGEWENIIGRPDFSSTVEYRLRPRICSVKVGDKVWEFPEPVRKDLEAGQEYWVVNPRDNEVKRIIWQNDSVDHKWLSYGLIHLTQAAAEHHLSALQAVNGQVAL